MLYTHTRMFTYTYTQRCTETERLNSNMRDLIRTERTGPPLSTAVGARRGLPVSVGRDLRGVALQALAVLLYSLLMLAFLYQGVAFFF